MKNDIETYDVLEKWGNQKQAIVWAKKLEETYSDEHYSMHNPCTLVYKLIEELISPEKILKMIEDNEK